MSDCTDETAAVTPSDAPTSAGELPIGTLLNGRYELDELLGRGGMGVVYRATDSLEERDVALKLLRRETLSTTSLALFKAEFRTLGTLHHPNIAAVFDFAERQDSGDFFFTMELISGKNAFEATEGVSVDAILDIGLQVLRALAYLHTRGVIHLDLKPANILVTADGSARVLDFGVAHSAHSQSGGRYATPVFMAPELSREGAEVDRRADIYSFGVTLFQLLFRRLPQCGGVDFTATSDSGGFALSERELASLPSWLPAIFPRLIARDPGQRFRSANEVIAAINDARGDRSEIETDETRDSYVASTALVGRDDAISALLGCLHQRLLAGRHCAILALCAGPGGSGKSRVLREIRQQCQVLRHSFFHAQCYGETGAPYAVWERIVTEVATLLGPEARAHGPVIQSLAPALAARIGLTEQAKLDPSALAKRLVALLLASGRPCVVSLDDLHWIDAPSLQLLELVIERCAEAERTSAVRLGFLCTVREEVSEEVGQTLDRLRSARAVQDVVLRPLAAAEVGELVSSMLGPCNMPADLAHGLAVATGGNALLVTEVMHAWIRDRSIIPNSAGWTFERMRSPREIADQLTHLLSDRLAELTPAQLRALGALAVFGRPLRLDLLEALLGTERETLLSLVLDLRQKHLLFLAHEELHFSATRWRDCVLEGMAAETRAGWHNLIADLIAPSMPPELVAFHYERGQNLNCAAAWFGRAALQHFERENWQQVLGYAQKAADCGTSSADFGHVCSRAAEAGRRSGDRRAAIFAQLALTLLVPGSSDWLQASRVAIAAFNPRLGR